MPLILYSLLVVAAEVLVVVVGPLTGALANAGVLLALVNHAVLVPREAEPPPAPDPPVARIASALALVPLLQLVSLGLAVRGLGPYTYLVVGVPLLLAAFLAARALGLREPPLRGIVASEALVGLAGVPLGLAAFVILAPPAFARDPSLAEAALTAAAVFVVGGVIEEVVFRGILQRTIAQILPRGAVIITTVLFAGTYLTSRSIAVVGVFAGVGLLFGWWAQRTGSVVGVAVAHGLLSAGLVVVWPLVL